MQRVATGFEFWPLSTGSTDAPSFVAGSPLTWNLSTIPIATDRKAYYLCGLYVTFVNGNITNASGTGRLLPQLALRNILIDSLELRNAFHGTPISPNHVKGYWLPTIEYLGGGYQYAGRDFGVISAADGVQNFGFSMFIPLMLGNGKRADYTAQLALMYRNAQFTLQCQPASILTAMATNSTISTAPTVRVSAVMLPKREIMAGPGVEWIDYQTPASSGQSEVQLRSFGNTTALQRSEAGAGVAFAMAMASVTSAATGNMGMSQPGAIVPSNVTQVQVPWRNQINTTHPHALVLQQLMSQGERVKLGNRLKVGTTSGGASGLDYADWPYMPIEGISLGTDVVSDLSNLFGLPLVPQGVDVQTSKMQAVDGDTSYFLQLSSGPSGTHHTLVQHVRSWSQDHYNALASEVLKTGLAKEVYGTTNLRWEAKLLGGGGSAGANMLGKKKRFLPLVLKP